MDGSTPAGGNLIATFASGNQTWEVFLLPDTGELAFFAGLDIDADGGPHAYHPDGKSGLDFLANAGYPGNWWALACNQHGVPFIQQANDPAPGFYISTTALVDPGHNTNSPLRYINAEEVPYIVLPSNFEGLTGYHVPLGTPCIVSRAGFPDCSAIYADVGPKNRLGEGSIALAKALGVPSDPRHGGISAGLSYRVKLPTA